MKARYFAIAAALMLSVALMGCSADRKDPMHSQDLRPSASVPGTTAPNDAMSGGGAGGTNDQNNDGRPDATPDASDRVSGDGIIDDIGDAAGDLIEGAGDGLEDAGDAVGDAAGRVGRAMHR